MAVLTITKENFNDEVMNSEQPVLVDFWADWCGPCKMVSPIVDEISEEIDHARVCKINVDEEPELAMDFKVMSIPTLMVFKKGKIIKKSIGVIPKDDILDMLD